MLLPHARVSISRPRLTLTSVDCRSCVKEDVLAVDLMPRLSAGCALFVCLASCKLSDSLHLLETVYTGLCRQAFYSHDFLPHDYVARWAARIMRILSSYAL